MEAETEQTLSKVESACQKILSLLPCQKTFGGKPIFFPNTPAKFLYHFRYYFFLNPEVLDAFLSSISSDYKVRFREYSYKSIHSLEKENYIWYKYWVVEILFYKFLQRSWLSKMRKKEEKQSWGRAFDLQIHSMCICPFFAWCGVSGSYLDALAKHPQMWL